MVFSSSSAALFLLASTVASVASTASCRHLQGSDKSGRASSVQSEISSVLGFDPSTITSQSQLQSVPSEYWEHVINDLPNELPFAKLWTGGFCPLAYGNPAPLGPNGTSRTACVKCLDGCAVCPTVFYDCVVCMPGYGLSNGACQKLVY